MSIRKSKHRLNVLVIEDNIGDARLITELLKEDETQDYVITFLDDLSDVDSVIHVVFDILLLDLHLSELLPIQTFKRVNRIFTKVPIVVLTGLRDDNLAIKVVRLGAQDYLIKGTFDANTLTRSIRYSIERKKSQARLVRAMRKSRRMQAHASVLEYETKRLEQLNKTKDVFLSIASHQLRTPATSVKQYIGLLLEGFAGPLPIKHKNFLEVAYQSNERQLRIVDDLLKVARLDAGHVTLHKYPTHITVLLQQIIDDQLQSFLLRNQRVYFSPLEPDEAVNIDADNMRMVFENILNNAGKYSPENSRIDIRIYKQDASINVEIKDRGIGIPEEDMGRLFQKFSRLDDSLAYTPDGSGLGLYWAKEIVKLHGGSIELESQHGKGSTFTIVMPFDMATVSEIPKLLQKQEAA